MYVVLYFAFKVSVLVRLPGLSSIRWLPVCGLETLVSPALRVLKNLRPAVLQLFYYISDRFLEKVNKAMVLFVKNRGLRLWWCGQPLSCHFVHLCLWMCCGRPSGFKLPYIIYNLLYQILMMMMIAMITMVIEQKLNPFSWRYI